MPLKLEISKIAKDTNSYLKNFIKSQKHSYLLKPMKYGLFSGGKKIRSKILVDVGKIFNINYKTLIAISAAVECIHSYSLIHDDLPCMDNDDLRRGKLSTHKKFGEATAVLAGNSLLTLAFEIIADRKLKNEIVSSLAGCSGHTGIAGGQELDLKYENKNKNLTQIIDMQIKKTGRLFSFCCIAPAIIKNEKKTKINDLNLIGAKIGLLFQIADDLIDFKGKSNIAGKKTGKDKKKGKATLISLLGYENAIRYSNKIKSKTIYDLKKYSSNSKDISETLDYILNRKK